MFKVNIGQEAVVRSKGLNLEKIDPNPVHVARAERRDWTNGWIQWCRKTTVWDRLMWNSSAGVSVKPRAAAHTRRSSSNSSKTSSGSSEMEIQTNVKSFECETSLFPFWSIIKCSQHPLPIWAAREPRVEERICTKTWQYCTSVWIKLISLIYSTAGFIALLYLTPKC